MSPRFCIFLALMLLPLMAFGGTARRSIEEGNRFFLEGDYEKALSRYIEAQVDLPQSPQVQLNIGAALYKQEKYEEAAASFRKIAENPQATLRPRAYHNLGNCNFKLNQLDEALQNYKKAIELDPRAPDPKFNYELTQRLLEQQSQQQKGEGSEEQQEGEESESQEKQAASPSPSPSPQPQQSEGKDQTQERQTSAASPIPAPSASPQASAEPMQPEELTKEQLEQLLNYLAGKENAASRPPRRLKDYPKPKRDW